MEPDLGEGLVLNPLARLSFHRDGDRPVSILVRCPVRERGLQFHEIRSDDQLFPVLERVLRADGDLELDLSDLESARLRDLGVLIEAREMPEPVAFVAPLTPPPALVPPSAAPAVAADDEPWLVNPSLRLQDGAGGPPLPDGVPAGPVLWVETPGTAAEFPYWPDGHAAALAPLLATRDGVDVIDASLRPHLRNAHVLVRAGERDRWRARLEAATSTFRAQHYVSIEEMCPPYFLAALRGYYRALVHNGYVPYAEPGVPTRFGAHNETVGKLILRQLAPVVQQVAGVPIKPAYCYFSRYQLGAVLEEHVDRRQCEYSVSLLLDYDPELADRSPWPLSLVVPATGEHVHIYQRLGEGLVYRGRQLPHYRKELPAGHVSVHIFCHYVDADFAGSLD
jgi:hypothetical protein